MNGDFIAALGWGLIHFLWQGALVGCAVSVLLAALRNALPQTRYLVLCLGLLLCLALPLFSIWQDWNAGNQATPADVEDVAFAWLKPDAGGSLLELVDAHMSGIELAWMVCVALLVTRMALGLAWVGRAPQLGASNAPLQLRTERLAQAFRIARRVRVRAVADLAAPITVGTWRPLILVPVSLLSGMAPEMLEALLAHELAHVKRHDYLVNLLQSVVEALLFYHPVVWWMSHRLRIERELVADRLAAGHIGEPRRLALALSELERVQFSHHHLAQAANGGVLMNRIARLVRPEKQAIGWKAAIPLLGLVCAGFAFYAHATDAATAASASAAAGLTTPTFSDLAQCKPVYPLVARNANQQGTVKVEIAVNRKGKFTGTKVLSSSGFAALDDATTGAFAKCKFKPAYKDGKPVASKFEAVYVWKLED